MKRIILSCMICICSVMQMHSQIQVLERCTPESQGVPSEKITALFDSLLAFPKTDIHSVMVLRHG
ncbi:MAG: serine hydrolase, partial [Parabacteroides sp.]|nr:serine hydrolase [Parabacteroides sp.]